MLPMQYKFLVDSTWRTSPCETIVSDKQVGQFESDLHKKDVEVVRVRVDILCYVQGSYNNQRSIACNTTFDWTGNESTREVFVAGDFSGWTVSFLVIAPTLTYIPRTRWRHLCLALRIDTSQGQVDAGLVAAVKGNQQQQIQP